MTDEKLHAAVAEAALALAAERPWREITLREIAERAKVPLDQLYGRLASKGDILGAVLARFDKAAVGELDFDAEATRRERVFDATMARFDAMEPHRAGLVSMLKDAARDPVLATRLGARALRTARWLLELANVDTAGVRGAARVNGFALILGRTTRAWMRDDAGDLAKTMASLDRSLRDVESWTERMKSRGFSKRRGERGETPTDPEPVAE